ncbi:MAG: ABC transporter permease, partial [Acetanaerobacterium sp.]
MKNVLFTATLREIRQTLSRFLSIFAIVALGTGFFAGVKATSPDMLISIDDYFDENHLADLRLVSTMGFDEDDIAAVRAAEEADGVMPAYTTDVLVQQDGAQQVLRLHSIALDASADENLLNRPVLVEGRMPARSGECLAEAPREMAQNYLVGDTITVQAGGDDPITDVLLTTQFTVVGTVIAPYYIAFDRGTTAIGSGTVDAFLFIPEDDFALPVYTDIYIAADGARAQKSYSDAYNGIVDEQTGQFEAVASTRERARFLSIVTEAQTELDDARQELDDAKTDADLELDGARKKLDDAQRELDDGYKEYNDGLAAFHSEIADAQTQLDDGYEELRKGQQEYVDGMNTYK